jgi:hypothetical protein
MIAAARGSGRALLRYARIGIGPADVAPDRYREFGLARFVRRAAQPARRGGLDAALPEAPVPETAFDRLAGEPKRHRVSNMAEALDAAGYAEAKVELRAGLKTLAVS